MTLDSWMVARLARELDALLNRARIVALRANARSLALECIKRSKRLRLVASLEPERPLAAVSDATAPWVGDEREPAGWVGGVAPLLRGAVVDGIHAVAGDRIVNIDLASRSTFGVPARHRLVLELEPRKANALIVRPAQSGGGIVLAAAKRFSGARGARALELGHAYELPPPRRKELDDGEFRSAVLAAAVNAEPRVLARLLGQWDPSCTPPLARDVVERALSRNAADPLADALLDEWRRLRARVESAAAEHDAPVFAWRRGSEIIACHLVPLTWPAGDSFSAASLNQVCAGELASSRTSAASLDRSLRQRLELMIERCDAEMADLRAAKERALKADALRQAGDAIYANLARIAPRSSDFVTDDGLHVRLDPLRTPKENAADYFRRYKKARSGLPRIEARLAALAANREHWEQLAWELDRTQAEPDLRGPILEEVTAAIGTPRRRARGAKTVRAASMRPKAVHDGVALGGGATAYVGRSPKDNDRLTFSVARPYDYWFHARGIPGAHVILRLPAAGRAASAAQIEAAAALAARASRAGDAGKVEVDYTQRKHVRRRGARTGLVWYTDFKTVLVAPAPR